MVMTEQGATWVPDTLAQMDHAYDHADVPAPAPPASAVAVGVLLAPVLVSASFLGADEAAARYDIGVDKLMWGSDYPHIEGTWPHTEAKLKEGFADVPRDEAQRMVGANAIEVFGFDRSTLTDVASRIGPPADLFGTAEIG